MNRISLAKRINNNKRGYLIINSNQGKHKIALIGTVINEYNDLTKEAKGCLENALVIGFAETATAIGATVASSKQTLFMQTTREDVPGCEGEYINFTEAHSHAKMQRIIKADMDSVYTQVEKIVFAEDEITTGNTIWQCIEKLEDIYKGKKKYAIVAIINALSQERREFFKEKNIDIVSLVDLNTSSFEEDVRNIVENGAVYSIYSGEDKLPCYEGEEFLQKKDMTVDNIIFKTEVQTRRLMNIKKLDDEIKKLIIYLETEYGLKEILEDAKSITVLGSEEFTYVPFKLAEYIDINTDEDTKVYTHSTTRSPIMACSESDYPLHTRYEVRSVYCKNRQTYVYDLKKSDILFLVTDGSDEAGFESVLEAIRISGNRHVYIIRWSNEEQL